MLPTVIPPSPDDMKSHFHKFGPATEIVSKIFETGHAISNDDIEQLQIALDQLKIDKEEDFDLFVPYVDRNFIKSCPSNPNVVCRYVGMVQDVLEPEYYVSKINGGTTHTKYRDLYCHENEIEDEISMNNYLEERQPILLVPVPGSTSWFRRRPRVSDTTSSPNHSEEPTSQQLHRKRSSEENISPHLNDDKCLKQTRSSSQTSDHNYDDKNNVKVGEQSDWWPQGYLGSDPEECAILAKVYENQQDSKMKLNTLVEVYGVLDLNPLGASFEEQRSGISEDDVFFGDFLDQLVVPPPSLLPRLHVLYYKPLDLDKMAKDHSRAPPTHKKRDNDKKFDTTNVLSERSFIIQTLAKAFDGNQILAESILMTLLSIAERNPNDSNRAIRLPSGMTLGAASLNLILPNTSACQQMSEFLCALISEIVPTVANIQLTLDGLNDVLSKSSITAPEKCHSGRMDPSIIQLPKASCVLLNQGAMTSGNISERGQRVLTTLAKMTRTHTVPYRFQGLYEIDFEADLRCIVVSSGRSISGSKLLPCTLKMKVESTSGFSISRLTQSEIRCIRHYVAKCRGTEDSSIVLSPKLLQKAQEDFVQRRQTFKGADGRSKVDEDDFHRWLTLTRLQARSRFQNIATVEDWTNAVLLDDKMMNESQF
jgi:hypothetical protein